MYIYTHANILVHVYVCVLYSLSHVYVCMYARVYTYTVACVCGDLSLVDVEASLQ